MSKSTSTSSSESLGNSMGLYVYHNQSIIDECLPGPGVEWEWGEVVHPHGILDASLACKLRCESYIVRAGDRMWTVSRFLWAYLRERYPDIDPHPEFPGDS